MAGRRSCHVAPRSARHLAAMRAELAEYMDPGGYLAWSARSRRYVILGTRSPRAGLVQCPSCRSGMLMMVRSPSTRKRFIGCSNYRGGCGASSPLLQRARLRATKRPCAECGWPVVIYRYSSRSRWSRMCSNVECPARAQPKA